MSIKFFKYGLGIFIPFFTFFLMSQNTFAASFNSWLNIQDISKTNLSSEWITHNTPNAGSYSVSGSTSLRTYSLSGSANLSSQLSGGYFNASADIIIQVPNSLEGGLNCNSLTRGYLAPENVNYTITSTNISSCYSETVAYMHKYIIHINTYGTITSGSPSSFYFYLVSSQSDPFITLVGTPNDSPRVFISGNVDFSVSNSPELNSLNAINDNVIVISQDLIDLSQQLDHNTDLIIRSNQHCYFPNLISLGSALGMNNVRRTSFNLDLEPGTYTLSFKLNDYDLGSTSNFNLLFAVFFANSSTDFNILTINSSTIKNNRYSYTFTINESTDSNSTSNNIRISNSNFDNGARASLSEIQLEKGTQASDYVPYGDEICKNFDQEYYDEQRQADQNISNQTPSDIQGATNQQTTNLIGVISSFVSALSSINTNGSCELTLPFPNLLGGSQTVNPCNGADKAPTVITVASSLLLISVFVPLAFILVKMIYNEIRSFTSG